MGDAAVEEDSAVAALATTAAAQLDAVLSLVAHGTLSADGPLGVALVRRLEGASIALRTLTDGAAEV